MIPTRQWPAATTQGTHGVPMRCEHCGRYCGGCPLSKEKKK